MSSEIGSQFETIYCRETKEELVQVKPAEIRKSGPAAPNFLTILIVSAPKNSKTRDLIRNSWLLACNRLGLYNFSYQFDII